MTVLGVDPGLAGGIGWIDGDGCPGCTPMPTLAGRIDLTRFSGLLLEIRPSFAVIESPSIRPGESGRSALTIGINWGLIAGLLTERGISWEEVTPQCWKKELQISVPPKSTPKQKKEASIAKCQRLFPTADLRASERCKAAHDGLAEALLIAEYARRIRGKG